MGQQKVNKLTREKT